MQCAIGYYKILEMTIISVDFNSFTGVGNRQGPPFAGDAGGEIGGEGRPEAEVARNSASSSGFVPRVLPLYASHVMKLLKLG